MARRISWTNNSSGHSGTYVYRAPTLDPQDLPAPVATVDPVAQGATAEWVDSEELTAGDYDYAVQDFDGSGTGQVSAVSAYTAPDDYSTVVIGDEIGGGIYAGTDTIDGTDYHIVSGDAASEAYGLEWKTTRTDTVGTDSMTDGLANTQAMEVAGLADHPAAAHCLAYGGGGHSDWHMPARSQLTLIYTNLAGHAEFADNLSSGNYTWASTQREKNVSYADEVAYARRFSDGNETGGYYKDAVGALVRPVRRVAV